MSARVEVQKVDAGRSRKMSARVEVQKVDAGRCMKMQDGCENRPSQNVVFIDSTPSVEWIWSSVFVNRIVLPCVKLAKEPKKLARVHEWVKS
jgi:hypothetical protein